MLSHKGTGTIETERLILRRFTIDDAENMYNNWVSDNEVCKYMRWMPHKSIEETEKCISNWIGLYNKEAFYLWVITFKKDNEPKGSIGRFVVNENDLCGDIGYCIGRKSWGQGIATEALRSVLNFAFNTVGFNRIESYHSVNNPASGRVMEKSGMIFEGFAKQKYKSISGFEDCNMYSIVKEDFK